MFRRRREPVPFAFVAEAERFRSNVTPPPKERATASEIAGRTLMGLTIVAMFAGALLFGMPSMEAGAENPHQTQQSEASNGR